MQHMLESNETESIVLKAHSGLFPLINDSGVIFEIMNYATSFK